MAPSEWLVIIPDLPGTAAKRMELLPQHGAGMAAKAQAGAIKFGGVMLNSHPAEGSPPDFAGSCVVGLAESRDSLAAALAEDVFAKNGVWDMSKMQIWAFKSAPGGPPK